MSIDDWDNCQRGKNISMPGGNSLRSPLEWKVNAFAAEVARVYGRGDDRRSKRNGEKTVRWKGEGGEGVKG